MYPESQTEHAIVLYEIGHSRQSKPKQMYSTATAEGDVHPLVMFSPCYNSSLVD